MMKAGAMRLVVVHFPSGAIALGHDGSIDTAASVNIPATELVSANGAGDAFAAGLLYALHENWSVAAALELAHASAAMSLRALSTCASVEGYETCLAQARKWGRRAPL